MPLLPSHGLNAEGTPIPVWNMPSYPMFLNLLPTWEFRVVDFADEIPFLFSPDSLAFNTLWHPFDAFIVRILLHIPKVFREVIDWTYGLISRPFWSGL